MNNKEIGKIGEDIANKYLLKIGYLILTRNHRERFDEIDIIARHPAGALIFCEVKTTGHIADGGQDIYGGFMPEDNLSPAKHRKMIRRSGIFLARHRGLIRENAGWQIDLIAIVLDGEKLSDLRHYENI